MSESKYVTIERTQLVNALMTLGMKESEAKAWISYTAERLCTIEDFQKDILDNTKRWFPNVYEDAATQRLTNLLGVFGEAGEMADVYKKFVRGSLTEEEYQARMIEESIDLMHYLFQWWHIESVNIRDEYLNKTMVNEERFGQDGD